VTSSPEPGPSPADRSAAPVEAREPRRYRDFFTDAADAMLILDNERQVVEANRAASALFGRTALAGCLLGDL
jgi:PAS domain-containing protein